MIVLKILLFILLAVSGLILLVLILPVGAEMSFIDGKLKFKVKLWLLNVMDSSGGGILGRLKRRKQKKADDPGKKKKKRSSGRGVSSQQTEIPDIGAEIPESTPSQSNEELPELSDEDISALDEINDIAREDVPRKKKKKDKSVKEDSEEKKKKRSLSELAEFLIDVWGCAKDPAAKIFKGFRFSDLYIDFVIANEDAYKCAVSYGRYSAIIYNGIAALSTIFTVRLKTVDIQPGFGLKKGRWDVSFALSFRAGTAVIAGIWFLITYIFRVFIPGKIRKRKAKKARVSAGVQK